MSIASILLGFTSVAASVRRRTVAWAALMFVLGLGMAAAGCSKATATAPPPPPPLVEVIRVEQKDVPLYSDWIGTLDGMVNAEIKAQVSGYLLSKNYTEGSLVHKGQLMFEIDPRPFEAALDQAKGNLAQTEGQLAQANAQLAQAQAQVGQAQANQGKTQMDVDRYAPLAKDGVITQQDYDTAHQANLANTAQLRAQEAGVETARAAIAAAKSATEAARAAVRTAELNLSFTKVVSPIEGVAGIALAQVGNLVGPASGDLTTVSTVNPIKAHFTMSEQEYLGDSRHS